MRKIFNFGKRKPFHKLIKENAVKRITDTEFIENEIKNFKLSRKRHFMLDGEHYYEGKHDILKRKRTAIGVGGELTEVKNVPNNKIVDNQYKKMVDQKNNYLLGQPISFYTENNEYHKELLPIFNKRFNRLIKNIGEDSLNCGIGWLFIHYDEQGELSFKRFKPFEVIAGWSDAEHTKLDYAIRIYEVIAYEGTTETVIEKVEVYDENGITFFERNRDGKLKNIEPFHQNYFVINETGYNWSKIPLIPFKYNSKEIPLINMVKSLQNGINLITSNFQNTMEEDSRNTIMVLIGYNGENIGEFRQNLATYGAVKVDSRTDSSGDVKTIQVEVNAENYKTILSILKNALIENAMGYDGKDERLSGNPNQMNIQSMYSDIDLDANNMETEFQASFEDMLWFIKNHIYNKGLGDFEKEEVHIIFNRDILMNEAEIIDNCGKSIGLLSDETVIANHPWTDDPKAEMERIEKQNNEKLIDDYDTNFSTLNKNEVGD